MNLREVYIQKSCMIRPTIQSGQTNSLGVSRIFQSHLQEALRSRINGPLVGASAFVHSLLSSPADDAERDLVLHIVRDCQLFF